MKSPSFEPDDKPVAAVDLGSNSFHLVIARPQEEELQVIDRLRDPVRMGAGLDEKGRLTDETVQRVLDSLERMGQRLRDVPLPRVRAVGTNTWRKARAPRDLLERADAALGLPIEVLSGAEEARLVFLGVSHALPSITGRRLVVDIGGGSTECILGAEFTPIYTDSLQMGCVSYSERFFPRGKLTRKGFQKAEIAAKLELETIERRFRRLSWEESVGSSGTITSIESILNEGGVSTPSGITLDGIKQLRRAMIDAGSPDRLDLPGLSQERAQVLAGGVAILKAVFESLQLESMHASHAALREGVLYDLLGRFRHEDVRDRTIRTLSLRYHVDEDQAERVERTAFLALDQVLEAWGLRADSGARLLSWAARMHEIGLALSHSGYHKHGAYILLNSTLPGFSRQDQAQLAALVRLHRRKFRAELLEEFSAPVAEELFALCILLRIAVRLNRTRSQKELPAMKLTAGPKRLELAFPPGWLEAHPLTAADLEQEAESLAPSGFELVVV